MEDLKAAVGDSSWLRDEQLSKHTPGPWHVYPQGDREPGFDVYDENDMYLKPQHLDTKIANAALIARAPDLLAENTKLREQVRELVAALEKCVGPDFDTNEPSYRTSEIRKQVRSLLAKVKAS